MPSQFDGVRVTPEGGLDGTQPWFPVNTQGIYTIAVDGHSKSQSRQNEQKFPKEGFTGLWMKFQSDCLTWSTVQYVVTLDVNY